MDTKPAPARGPPRPPGPLMPPRTRPPRPVRTPRQRPSPAQAKHTLTFNQASPNSPALTPPLRPVNPVVYPAAAGPAARKPTRPAR